MKQRSYKTTALHFATLTMYKTDAQIYKQTGTRTRKVNVKRVVNLSTPKQWGSYYHGMSHNPTAASIYLPSENSPHFTFIIV